MGATGRERAAWETAKRCDLQRPGRFCRRLPRGTAVERKWRAACFSSLDCFALRLTSISCLPKLL